MRIFSWSGILFFLCAVTSAYSGEPGAQMTSTTDQESTVNTTKEPQEKFSPEWQELCARKAVKNWYLSALEDPQLIESDENCSRLPLLHLFELRDTADRFDRKIGNARQTVEKAIATDIEKIFEGKPLDTPVRLLSLDSVGLLQDWFIIGHLLKQGRTNIELALVNGNSSQAGLDYFFELEKVLLQEGVSLTITSYKSVSECAQAQKKPFSVAYSIDALRSDTSIETFDNVLSAKELLDQNCHVFFSYFAEIVSFDAKGVVHVLETSQLSQAGRETIVAAQLKNPRPKDRPVRIIAETSNPGFFFNTLFYAVSDLCNQGYQDIVINVPDIRGFYADLRPTITRLFSLLNTRHSTITFHWKGTIYLRDRIGDCRDLAIFWFDNVDVQEFGKNLNDGVIVLGSCMTDQSHWIVCGKDLGLWDVDGKGATHMVLVHKENKELAMAIMHDIFKPGSPWYKGL